MNKTGYSWSWSLRSGHANGRSSQALSTAAQASSAANAGIISSTPCLRRVLGASKKAGSSLSCNATHRTAGPKSPTWSLAAPTTQSRTTGTLSYVTNAVSCARTWISIWTAASSSIDLMTLTSHEKTYRSACWDISYTRLRSNIWITWVARDRTSNMKKSRRPTLKSGHSN